VQNLFSPQEWQLRVDLAACYRLTALYGWSDLIFTHISAKLPDDGSGKEKFLINPYGLFFDEMTASDLLVVDLEGNLQGPARGNVNRAGFVIHSTIHAARPDVQCVLHTHSKAGVAVSIQEDGLLRLSQQSTLILQSLAYHDYQGVAVHDKERASLVGDLGHREYMILLNHGLLAASRSIAEAFMAMYLLESACQIQLAAQGSPRLRQVTDEVQSEVEYTVRIMEASAPVSRSELAWSGLLRRLDRLNPGYAQ
jgi:ribulose-5-phosphate 4-epimerase/fuculose-1-phosphate aldolase